MTIWFMDPEEAAAFVRRNALTDPFCTNNAHTAPRNVVGWRGHKAALNVPQHWRLLHGVEAPDEMASGVKVRELGDDLVEVYFDNRTRRRVDAE